MFGCRTTRFALEKKSIAQLPLHPTKFVRRPKIPQSIYGLLDFIELLYIPDLRIQCLNIDTGECEHHKPEYLSLCMADVMHLLMERFFVFSPPWSVQINAKKNTLKLVAIIDLRIIGWVTILSVVMRLLGTSPVHMILVY
jgi:hypothetical protein